MTQCKDNQLSEMLAAALWPDEFPAESDLIRRHAAQCPECRAELNQLRAVHGALVIHKELLASVEADEKVGNETPCAQERDHAPETFDNVARSDEILEPGHAQAGFPVRGPLTEGSYSITAEERRVVRAALDMYAPSPARAQAKESALNRLLNWARDSFQPISLVCGAALASLIILLVPTSFQERVELVPLVSDSQWTSRRMALMKGVPQGPEPTQSALVILAPRDRPLSAEEITDLYKEIDLGQLRKQSFAFLSPEDTGKIVGNRSPVTGVSQVRDAVFQKSGVTYLVTFEILNSTSGCAVKGTLFKRGEGHDIGSLSQTGLQLGRVPARISAITQALLEEAHQ